MTKIKLCGMQRAVDIAAANRARPEYVGFVFARESRRAVTAAQAAVLRAQLAPEICAVGVFVDAPPEMVARLLHAGTIDVAQLHGHEDAAYLKALRKLTAKPLIQAFRIAAVADVARANASSAEMVLVDAGAGSGICLDWRLLDKMQRPYFLAGGLTPENVAQTIARCAPYAVDVSSGIETAGVKDDEKIQDFVKRVRRDE